MGLIKTSITISEDLLHQAKQFSGNFSSFVTQALKEYIRLKKVERALNSFGKWEKREKDSVSIVNELRSEEGREYAERTN